MARKQQQKNSHRPSDKEICQKITQAIEALQANRYLFITSRHRSTENEFLQISTEEELLDWVAVFLDEIQEIGPVECFVNPNIPRCSHKGYKNLFLFAYAWRSLSLDEDAYLKFAIRKESTATGETRYYCHLDCHENRP